MKRGVGVATIWKMAPGKLGSAFSLTGGPLNLTMNLMPHFSVWPVYEN